MRNAVCISEGATRITVTGAVAGLVSWKWGRRTLAIFYLILNHNDNLGFQFANLQREHIDCFLQRSRVRCYFIESVNVILDLRVTRGISGLPGCAEKRKDIVRNNIRNLGG